jgi:RNA polymerase sigma factor (sigma-70 family)
LKTTALPPVPKLEHPDAIKTAQGIDTLRVYMFYMKRKYNLRVVHPFSFEDMFQDAYAFLLEHVHEWKPELSNFDTWATEMMRYGWLYAVRDMHWLKYRLIDKQHQIEGRRMTRFGEDEWGRSEQDAVPDPSDDFGTLEDDSELESLLSQLEPRDRRIVELTIEGYSGAEIDEMIGTTGSMRYNARLRVAETLGLERPARTLQYHELTDEHKEQILEQYAKLGSYKRVSGRLGIHHSAIGKVVRGDV